MATTSMLPPTALLTAVLNNKHTLKGWKLQFFEQLLDVCSKFKTILIDSRVKTPIFTAEINMVQKQIFVIPWNWVTSYQQRGHFERQASHTVNAHCVASFSRSSNPKVSLLAAKTPHDNGSPQTTEWHHSGYISLLCTVSNFPFDCCYYRILEAEVTYVVSI